MGARGPLKLVKDEDPAKVQETAQDHVPALAPAKPRDVEEDPVLNGLWDELVPELDRAGLLSPADALAVEMALRHLIMARMAYSSASADGVVVPDPAHGGVKKHPAEAVFRLESGRFLDYAKQLGMTFAGRARIPVGGDSGEPNPFE